MLPASKRLSKKDFVQTFSSGKRIQTPYFSFIYTPSDQPKFSVVVSKKIEKRAVDRNHLRRKVYNFLNTLPLPPLTGIIIIRKKAPFEEVQQTLKKVLL